MAHPKSKSAGRKGLYFVTVIENQTELPVTQFAWGFTCLNTESAMSKEMLLPGFKMEISASWDPLTPELTRIIGHPVRSLLFACAFNLPSAREERSSDVIHYSQRRWCRQGQEMSIQILFLC